LEHDSSAAAQLRLWRERLAAGHASFRGIAEGGAPFNSLFVWLVNSSGERLADGFRHASDCFQLRAQSRAEMMLGAALPTMVLLLGLMILGQIVTMFLPMLQLVDTLGM
jgi:type II secretory pathway component PulF